MANTTFSGPVTSTNGFVGDVVGAVQLPTYTVASAPSAAASGAGTQIFVSNGAAGSPVVAFSDGTNFLRVDTLAAIAAA
tara:strand:+ start:12190 stop:12426 length:237 start_codon:yes stop_codon:yes gene_type:complete